MREGWFMKQIRRVNASERYESYSIIVLAAVERRHALHGNFGEIGRHSSV